jgi:pimeloyl-ACP methyl ester carboxylesterase
VDGAEPLAIAGQGHFFAGVTQHNGQYGTAVTGMHVGYQVPAEQRHQYPLVLANGGQGLDFLTTPDGRAGWATLFVTAGYAVYVADRPGAGRSPYHPDLFGPLSPPPAYGSTVAGFAAPAGGGTGEDPPYPQAPLHTQWPGSGLPGDHALDQFLAGQEAMAVDLESEQEAMRGAGADLLDRIGPAVLVTHSMGSAFGWLVADARPDLVKAIVAVEPLGPPFASVGGVGTLRWGLTAVPVGYDPPASDPDELHRELLPAPEPGLIDAYVQAEPARSIPALRDLPVAIVTAEASRSAQFGHAVAGFLRQAGADVTHLRLADRGIHGNGQLMMLERNNAEIADAIDAWISARTPA